MPPVLNKPWLWIWLGCICRGYPEFQICRAMAPYASIMPGYASIYLNVHQYGWIFQNVPECMNIPEHAWINFSTAHKMKFSIKDFFCKCAEIRSFPQIWSHLLKKSLLENFIFVQCSDYARVLNIPWITFL